MEMLSRLDWLGRLHWIDMHSPAAKEQFPDLDLDRGAMEMLVRTSGGVWLGGYEAVRAMVGHMPLFWLVMPFLYLPPVPSIGGRIYKRIAEHRYCVLPLPAKAKR